MELVEHYFSFHASATRVTTQAKVNILAPSIEGGKIMFSQMSVSFLWQKYCCARVCKQVQDKYIPIACLLHGLIHDISLSRIRIRNSYQNYAMKIHKKYIPVRVLSTETAQVLLLKPLLSAVPYIPTGLSMHSSQQLLHHLYSSHISSSIQDEQTFAIT